MITAMQDEISKTRRKKEMLELQSLGAALVELPQIHLDAISLPENLKGAVLEARRIKTHEGKRRQMQYIGRLMRDVDPAPIRAELEAFTRSSAQSAAAHRRLEAWRGRLLADDAALTEFAAEHPGIDVQQLRNLIRSVKRDLENGKPPRSYRELFRFIKECSISNPS
jgi:ribosome-associated protein